MVPFSTAPAAGAKAAVSAPPVRTATTTIRATKPAIGDDVERYLLVEVSDTRKSVAMTKEKADTVRTLWCASVNNLGGFGRWGFLEIRDPSMALADLIKQMYADGPITGLPS